MSRKQPGPSLSILSPPPRRRWFHLRWNPFGGRFRIASRGANTMTISKREHPLSQMLHAKGAKELCHASDTTSPWRHLQDAL